MPSEAREGWPWHLAPLGCEDYDEATWHAVRRHQEVAGGPTLPRQSLEVWVARMRASRELDEVRYRLDVAREVGRLL